MYSAELLEEARRMMFHMLSKVVEYGGSDLFISADFPPSIKHQGLMKPLGQQNLPSDQTKLFAYSLMNEKQRLEFETELECNFAINVPNVSRFRVNVFQQQLHVGMVIRTITAEIPNFTKLQLPTSLKDVIMEKRGLVLVVGGTGSGKSTSLAAMIDHRNENSAGHIITVEDPVEYVHKHKKSMITHREVGVDCHSWHNALKNTLRQAPDVILIGEIRDTETMEHAIAFAETGHLCLGTLHANNANQALDRIINFFPDERRNQLLMDLSSNMKAIISQRLVRTEDGRGRRAAVEIMLNTPLMSDLILKGNFHELKEVMSKSRELGMQTFDQALFDLYNQGAIAYEEALRNADSVNELRLQIKLKSSRANPQLNSNSALSFDQAVAEKAKDAEEEKADA
ncbi:MULTISPECIES: PilT/PilU family type 4a pilus ATPase [Acinetobacter]|jgi:twitching motility protein PilU|uniref:PilT/PilU family type 4a pilus ATPase n=1 Tax=Acinetobacter johnsonii TaxID=40214 RepID=A0A239RZK9_ACIJO|nr:MULTISPECIES: PilT/PilU family type 4a pilus ATPase [Acinetobacter]ALV73035.1 twitching motility protein PilT [Acinetobacter johnsonii XBB1]MCV2452747.1 PilT/PilU family type 4a pilus ATPase [Acinetobacter johnsonii]MDG9786731.1 PilT/PilU family type 4a pilus ATPase [Acinetobacter johnsonii]MDG9798063.1 PilT/PilU family type 4a pilus ATPase [Acinetobacter johnsonii]MDH1240872.1 PilT/PilU family type 4a pilus ATPase [Acinetobacter johnsonii]